MNKKGQGLPLNTVVIAILVIVVLILLITFLFGGFTGLSLKIRDIFFGSLAGTSETLAIQQCDQYCSQIQLRSDPGVDKRKALFDGSTFCKPRPIDVDEDGKADFNMNCVATPELGVSCSFQTKEGKTVPVECGVIRDPIIQ